jgi:hypothetical protein
MIKLFLSVTLSLISYSGLTQALKNYSGAFENGTAIYQYYENDKYERVYHGPFSYKSGTLTVTGKFSDDKKDGDWKAINRVSYSEFSEVVSGTFSKGNFEGKWIYTRTSTKTGKIIGKSIANFKNNVRVGNYEHWRNDDENIFSINYNLNQQGTFEGDYNVTYQKNGKKFEELRKYRNGVLVFRLFRDLSNGEVLEKYDKTEAVNNFFSFYDSITKIAVIPKYNPNSYNFRIASSSTSAADEMNRRHLKYDSAGQKYLANIPFTLQKDYIRDIDAYWDLLIATNFWDNNKENRYGGFFDNPIFKVERGSNPTDFNPVRLIVYKEQ